MKVKFVEENENEMENEMRTQNGIIVSHYYCFFSVIF